MSETTEVQQSDRPAHLFKPGQSGNPAGRPFGAKDRLARNFAKVLAADFKEHGVSAVIECREKKPDQYLKVVADFIKKDAQGFQGGAVINILINADEVNV